MPHRLTLRALDVSIVTYRSDATWLDRTLDALYAAIEAAKARSLIGAARVLVVDNAPVRTTTGQSGGPTAVRIAGQGNVGYGAANNLALRDSQAHFVLVLNPDVDMSVDALANGIAYLDATPAAALVSPVAVFPDGSPQYLAKGAPTVLTLMLRGFAPRWLARRHADRLAAYERADVPFDAALTDANIVSGCFMLMRGEVWRQTGGFDENFFLYFEDFDLSLRIAQSGRIDRVPQVRIVHAGGHAARKGGKHIWLFIRSAIRFFNKHGWRWW